MRVGVEMGIHQRRSNIYEQWSWVQGKAWLAVTSEMEVDKPIIVLRELRLPQSGAALNTLFGA